MHTSPSAFWSTLRKERFLIVGGLGQTGYAAARLFHRMGVPYRISDTGSDPQKLAALSALGLHAPDILLGPQQETQLSGVTQILLSPGVSRTTPLLLAARARKLPIWYDFDLLYPLYADKPIAAITGTDGKTTTTSLLGHMLESDRNVLVAGNIGLPISDAYEQLLQCETVVLELSSFMLEDLKRFRANTATITNIAEDHVDRYASRQDYAETKRAIVRYARPHDCFVKNLDDERIRSWDFPNLTIHSVSHKAQADGMLTAHELCLGDARLPTRALKLQGKHLHFDVLLAARMAVDLGVSPSYALDRAQCFEGVAHRFERIGLLRGIEVIDDSKATSVQAVCLALSSLANKRVVLILGGQDKMLDPTALREFTPQLRAVVGYGQAGSRLLQGLNGVQTHYLSDFRSAVTLACRLAQAGDALLLSPACTSFDQHRDYRERGAQFRGLCRTLLA